MQREIKLKKIHLNVMMNALARIEFTILKFDASAAPIAQILAHVILFKVKTFLISKFLI